MGPYWSLCVLMDSIKCLGVFIGCFASQWVFIGSFGPYGSLCVLMGPYVSL